MTGLREELRLIGCHANGDARCTCAIGQDALALIDAQADALRLALPVMRRGVCEYLEGHTVKGDPATVTPDEWAEIAADVAAIRAATAIVGPHPDQDGVDTAWLDAALERAP